MTSKLLALNGKQPTSLTTTRRRKKLIFAEKRWDSFLFNAWHGIFKSYVLGMRVYCPDFVAHVFLCCPISERRSIEAHFKPLPGQTVVDVGAHIGCWTLYAASRVGPEGRVIAIEPHPANVVNLRLNLQLNRLKNVVIKQVALGKEDGETILRESSVSASHSAVTVPEEATGQKLKVPLRRLDSLLEELKITGVDWIKVNAEGAEYNILLGSEDTLKQQSAKILVQTHGQEGLAKVSSLLEKFGYRVQTVCMAKHRFWGELAWLFASKEVN